MDLEFVKPYTSRDTMSYMVWINLIPKPFSVIKL